MNTSAVVFLFNSAAEGVSRTWYGGDFDSAFLKALSAADPEGRTRSAVLRGDALIGHLTEKIRSIQEEGASSKRIMSYDKDLYRTVVWDLADALATQ